ncbi:MAG: 30S ribosomal protein S27ae [Candidatus Methanomethylicia archaeon]|nr:30S ribosomal protein S27ae [Candidatus Methanomethylicia archaeon]MDW7988519.1 30S ribosomal protein S27ae [Nitrososphaerota archaeon]
MAERHKLYKYDYSTRKITFLNRYCPKCNRVMANHKDRFTCGYCHYTVFVKK